MDPLSWRNNNPGNLRGQYFGATGSNSGFAVYPSMDAGWRAMERQLDRYYLGESTGKPITTLAGIIGRWAPKSENPTNSYISRVAEDLGVDPAEPLDWTPTLKSALMTAMATHEAGRPTVHPAAARTVPAASFPQFSPRRMAATLRPVSAQPNMNLLTYAQQQVPPEATHPGGLLATAAPSGLLDRFSPGSGFGYDVATGIANARGGPLTALAGGMAYAGNQALKRQQMLDTSMMRREEFGMRQQKHRRAMDREQRLEQMRESFAKEWEAKGDAGKAELIRSGVADNELMRLAGLSQEDRTAAMQNYRFLRDQGIPEADALERAFSGGTTVNVGAKAPSGYWWTDSQGNMAPGPGPGVTLQPIPGGPATQADQSERKAASQRQQAAAEADKIVEAFPSGGFDPVFLWDETVGRIPGVGNMLQTSGGQLSENAQEAFLDNYVYWRSGATSTPDERANKKEFFFPETGDSAATIREKANRVRRAVDAWAVESGRAGAPNPSVPAPAAVNRNGLPPGWKVEVE